MNQEGTRPGTSDPVDSPPRTKSSLNQVVQRLACLRQHNYHHHNIGVILDLAPELPRIAADGQQIECVLLALFARARNAIIEAKRSHGTITVRTALKAGKIQFSITDDGIADPSSGILQTFFTRTLEEDMTLTTCAEIVQDQGGELYAWHPHDSAVTTILMDLPVDG